MLDVLTWIVVLLCGGLLMLVAGAIFIAAIFWAQNGGDDD
jgi:hypothetical protein